MDWRLSWVILMGLLGSGWVRAQPAADAPPLRVRVFVALCDNASQGIAPVPAKIGDGDVPAENLYWGCSEGLAAHFGDNPQWERTAHAQPMTSAVLERAEFRRRDGRVVLIAEAYRGAEIRQCLLNFEQCVGAGDADLVAYIGHNGLMDFDLPECERAVGARRVDAIVLCCKSQEYFAPRLAHLGARPVLLTRQFMYPGAFLLDAALEKWAAGDDLSAIRQAAGAAYARNQGISIKAATGVFAPLDDAESGESKARTE